MKPPGFRFFVEFSLNHYTITTEERLPESLPTPPPKAALVFPLPHPPRVQRGRRGGQGQAEAGAGPALPITGPPPPAGPQLGPAAASPAEVRGGPVRSESREPPPPHHPARPRPRRRLRAKTGGASRPSAPPLAPPAPPPPVAVLTGARRVTGSAMGTDRRGAAAAAPHTTAPFANQTGGRSLTLPRLSLNPVLLYYWTTSYDARVRLVRLHRPHPRRKRLEPLPVAAACARGAAPPSGRGRARAHGRRSLTPKSAGTAPAAAAGGRQEKRPEEV